MCTQSFFEFYLFLGLEIHLHMHAVLTVQGLELFRADIRQAQGVGSSYLKNGDGGEDREVTHV